MVDRMMFGEGHARVAAVDARTRCVDEVPDLVMPAALQDVEKSFDVRRRVGVGVAERVAHPRLGGEMDDRADLCTPENRLQSRPVADIQLMKLERRMLA